MFHFPSASIVFLPNCKPVKQCSLKSIVRGTERDKRHNRGIIKCISTIFWEQYKDDSQYWKILNPFLNFLFCVEWYFKANIVIKHIEIEQEVTNERKKKQLFT